MSPIIAILWWLSLGAVAIGASRDDCHQELLQSRQEERKP